MWDDDEGKGEAESRCLHIAYSYPFAPRRLPGLADNYTFGWLCSEELNFLGVAWRALLRSRDLRIPDLTLLSTLFWLDPMGLGSGADSVALTTTFGGKGPPFEAMTCHATKCPRRFPNWGSPGFSSVVRQMPVNLLHCPRCPPHYIITLITFLSATDRRDRRSWPGANGLPGWEPVASA